MPSRKDEQRRAARLARDLQPDKEALSAALCSRLIAQAAYQAAGTVLWYVGCKSEVQTLQALRLELEKPKHIVIPYCTHDEHGRRKLGLWHLESLTELTPGTWNIPEPPKSRWGEAGKEVSPSELDLVIVPGVAFDRSGGRLGNGAGYYDRLLAGIRKDTVLYGVCFESQLLDRVVMHAHDVPMDAVITETAFYPCRGR
ncbi:5-formyltetrahydrofolate cyclo-ligase [Methylomicrobium lacus]|uniref:5-formyltetrahydrofolate cyclo-ligase n=1 Tax=Methylomicrobium lacus TaxID=136992 RepID=UPI0035A966FA